ncbi:hypothetical protein PG984_009239 [Apiospora sp. TS-2023a]
MPAEGERDLRTGWHYRGYRGGRDLCNEICSSILDVPRAGLSMVNSVLFGGCVVLLVGWTWLCLSRLELCGIKSTSSSCDKLTWDQGVGASSEETRDETRRHETASHGPALAAAAAASAASGQAVVSLPNSAIAKTRLEEIPGAAAAAGKL